jgi:hypothetical protein
MYAVAIKMSGKKYPFWKMELPAKWKEGLYFLGTLLVTDKQSKCMYAHSVVVYVVEISTTTKAATL